MPLLVRGDDMVMTDKWICLIDDRCIVLCMIIDKLTGI